MLDSTFLESQTITNVFKNVVYPVLEIWQVCKAFHHYVFVNSSQYQRPKILEDILIISNKLLKYQMICTMIIRKTDHF